MDESMRVFCPAHDAYSARYTDGRPLLDDSCPICEKEQKRNRILSMTVYLSDRLDIAPVAEALEVMNDGWIYDGNITIQTVIDLRDALKAELAS